MSETKRTVERWECCYCHRNLPLTYFPLKPGKKYARYKACRDCHPLGHSCIPKKQRKEKAQRKAAAIDRFYCSLCKQIKPAEAFITDGKQYKMCNQCRDKARARRAAEKAKRTSEKRKPFNPLLADPPKERKPRVGNGQGDRHEYFAKMYAERKDEIKAKQVLGAIEAEQQKPKPKPKPKRAEKLCWKCWLYPCFEGIDNMDSDFAKEGCISFKRKEELK